MFQRGEASRAALSQLSIPASTEIFVTVWLVYRENESFPFYASSDVIPVGAASVDKIRSTIVADWPISLVKQFMSLYDSTVDCWSNAGWVLRLTIVLQLVRQLPTTFSRTPSYDTGRCKGRCPSGAPPSRGECGTNQGISIDLELKTGYVAEVGRCATLTSRCTGRYADRLAEDLLLRESLF